MKRILITLGISVCIAATIVFGIFFVYKLHGREIYNTEGVITGVVAEYKFIKDSERNGGPAEIETTKAFSHVEVRAYEIIPEDYNGGTYYRNHGDMGIKTYTDKNGYYMLVVPLKSLAEEDGRYIQVYLPHAPFQTNPEIQRKGTMHYIRNGVINIEYFTEQSPDFPNIPWDKNLNK